MAKFVSKFTGQEIDTKLEAVGGKHGASYFDPATNTMLYFASKEALSDWLATSDSSLIIDEAVMNFTGTMYQVKVQSEMPSKNLYFTTQADKAEITVSFLSQKKGITDVSWQDIVEDYNVSVYVDKGGLGTFVPLIVDQFVVSGNTFTFDVKKALATGANRVRVVAVGTESADKAQGSEMFIVNLTSMYLAPSNFTWYKPFIEGETYALGGMNIGGNLNKTVKVKMSKEGYERLYEVNIGSNIYTTTAYVFNGLEFPSGGTGVYNVDIWLDANGLESDHLSYNIICVSQADKFTAQLVAIGDPAKTVFNFSDNKLFEYCVYNGGTATATPHIKVAYVVNTNPTTIIDEDLVDVATASPLTYTASLEIEMEDESAALQLEALMTYGNEQVFVFPVDNSKSYPATTGAVFYMNPSARNNAQSNREKVINSITGAEIDATFTRMAWTDGTDGWTTDDEGRKCLRLPAGCTMDVAYQPMASVSQKTIELVYKVKNAADYDEPIFTIGDVYLMDGVKEVKDTDITFKDGYIKPDNTEIGVSAGYVYSNPIFLAKGESIHFKTTGHGFASVAKTNDAGTSYTKIYEVTSTSTGNNSSYVTTVDYTATEDIIISICRKTVGVESEIPYIIRLVPTEGGYNPNFRGICIRPKNILIHSRDLNVNDSLQDYNTTDEETLHVLITIIPNYKTNYGNLAQIYVNGDKVRSFSFETADRWDVAANMKFGSETADTLWYKARVYDRGFESYDALKNYINSLPSTKAKEEAKAKIEAPLDDSYKVTYDECVKNGLNTMVVEIIGQDQTVPSIANPSAKTCNTWIKINNPIDGELDEDFARLFSGDIIEGETIEGQGTTAMTYARWNFRWKLSSKYNKRRITAKKNVASSMHSHKMGATRLFNDLNRAIVGPNDADSRVAVYQYPVYGFQKVLVEGTTDQYLYEFIGLYTIGPDKGDKATFGFDGDYESTLIHLEGTDHTPKGVGFDYPYGELGYSGSAEALGAVNATGAVVAAWECGAAGDYDPKDDPTETKAMLDAEFRPAYDVAELNSTYILGVTETLEEMNANISAWQAKKDAEGRSYADLMFFTDGVYDLYFYNTRTQKYEARGINMLDDLHVGVSGLSLEEKTELFKAKRRERFVANWETYWHKNDAIFHYAFVLLFGATDNFKKNTYPYKYRPIAEGGVYRWRQDDLDTLFDINNQGLAAKIYSILVGDKTETGSGSIYRGDTSAFWTLIKECFPTEIKAMVHAILDKMVELSPYGNNTLEKLVGCVRYYFWDKAQAYFPASAYSKDAEWTYEDTWAAGLYKEVNPLQQSLGGHKEAEIDWVTMRMLFCAMYFNYGPFGAVNDSFSDTSTGQIAYGGAGAKTYLITMACDGNPTILRGQSELVTFGDRVKAGETIELTVPDSSGADTRIYIQGVDWMEDIGDLSDLQVSADNPQLSVSSKRLQGLKIGDEDASKVTTNVEALNFGACPSMMIVDARNAKSLTGTIDLSKMPRLMEAYFGGTGVKAVNVPNGSKIAVLELGEETTQISLMNLKFMESTGLKEAELPLTWTNGKYIDKNNVVQNNSSYRYCDYVDVEGSPHIFVDGYFGTDNGLHFYTSDKSVIQFVTSTTLGVTANTQTYGNKIAVPANAKYVRMSGRIDATLKIIGYQEVVNGLKYTSLPKLEFLRIENCSQLNPFTMLKSIYNTEGNVIRDIRIIGFDVDGDASDVTMIANLANDVDKDGNPHVYNGIDAEGKPMDNSHPIIEGRLRINGNIYEEDYEALKAVFSNLVMEFLGFYVAIKDPEALRVLLANIKTDDGIGLTTEDIEGVTSIGTWFRNNGVVETFDEFERFSGVTTLGNEAFRNMPNLVSIKFPQSIKSIGSNAFASNAKMGIEVDFPSLTSMSNGAFQSSGIVAIKNLGNLASLQNGASTDWYSHGAFYSCKSLKSAILPSTLTQIGRHTFYNDTALESVEYDWSKLTHLEMNAFYNCAALAFDELRTPNLTTLGSNAFYNVSIKKWLDMGKITSLTLAGIKKDSLEELTIPNTITTIGSSVLSGYTALSLLMIDWDNITSIAASAFYNCTSLSFDEINLPNLTELGKNAFAGVKIKKLNIPRLTSLPLGLSNGSISNYGDKKVLEEVILSRDLTAISNYTFMGYSAIKALDVNWEELTSLGTYALSGLSLLEFEELNLPNLTSLGQYALNGIKIKKISMPQVSSIQAGSSSGSPFNIGDRNVLEEVELSENITAIPNYFFRYASVLTKVSGLSNVTTIGTAAFGQCPILESIDIDFTKLVSVGESAFDGGISVPVYDVIDAPNITSLGSNALLGLKIKKLSLGSIVSLGTYSVGDKSVLEELTLSDNLTVLPYNCFNGYTNLKSISNTDFVTEFGLGTFSSCNSLTYLYFPRIVTAGKGGNYGGAFSNSKNMNITLRLGPSCKTIGPWYLSYATDCKMTLICEAVTPPTNQGSHFHASTRCSFEAIYVPDESVDAYKAATNWSTYANLIHPISRYDSLYIDNTDEVIVNKAALNVIYKLQPCSATYSIDNPSLASIDENGILTVLGDGNVVVTATFNGISVSRQYELQKITITGALVSGFYVDRAGVLKTSSGSRTIKDIECVGPANLEWGTSIGKIDRLCQYDENKTLISFHETNNFTLAANARYITLSVTATSEDGIYLKDVDTGRYLWKSVIE